MEHNGYLKVHIIVSTELSYLSSANHMMPLALIRLLEHLMILRTFDWNNAKDNGTSVSNEADENDAPWGKPNKKGEKKWRLTR